MYNLTVATAHTYYVGEGQWLVHNALPCTENGQIGQRFAEEFFGQRPGTIRTPFGDRDVDLFDADALIAREVKTGEVRLSGPRIREELAKDIYLLSSGQVKEVEWVFLRSPSTGKMGGDPKLMEALRQAGIKVTYIDQKLPKP